MFDNPVLPNYTSLGDLFILVSFVSNKETLNGNTKRKQIRVYCKRGSKNFASYFGGRRQKFTNLNMEILD